MSSRTGGDEGETMAFPEGLGSFETFCEGLRRDLAIRFEAAHQIRLATLCGRLALRGVTLRTADEVAWHFVPAIATDPKLQVAVHQHIRDIWQESVEAVEESADDELVLSETAKVERALADYDRGRLRSRKAFRVVLVLVCVFLGGLLNYSLGDLGSPASTGRDAPDPFPGSGSWQDLLISLQQMLGGSGPLILAACVVLGGAAAILWRVARFGRQGVLRGLAIRSGDGADLYFDGLGTEFFSAPSGPRSVDALAQHREVPAQGVDVESSVVRTVRSGGLAHIVPGTVRRLPQYLILSSRESASDHHASLAEDLRARLAERQVIARRYDFFGSPLRAWEAGKASRTVEAHGFGDLVALAQTHGWILIDDTEDLFDPRHRSIYAWVRALAAAAPGVLMTSKPGSAWSWREAALENEGIKVVSVMEDDLRDAADFLSGRTMLVGSRYGWPVDHSAYRYLKRMMDALSANPDEPPNAETQEHVIRYLRSYLAFAADGAATFELFVATCIYPELKPDLTRMIARAARDDGDHLLASDVGLGALFALPWFRVGRIPRWLREKAVDSVDAERLAKLEQCVHAVLLEPQDRGRLNLKVAGRYPDLIVEYLYRRLPRNASARRDAIFLGSLGRAPERGVFEVSKAFVRRALGSSREALGIQAAVAVTAIGIAAIFLLGEVRIPAAEGTGFAAGYRSAISDALVGVWTNLLLVSATVVGGAASVVAVGLRQVGADGRVIGSLWRVGAWFLVGVAVLALVEPVPDSKGANEVYVAPLWVFAMATLYVTYVLHRAGGERISGAAWQGIARGRTLPGIVVACFFVLVLAAAGRAVPSFMSPLPEGAQQPVWVAMGAVLLAASAGRAIGLGGVGLLATGAAFIFGFLAGWALALDMSERFGFSPGNEATLILAGQAGLMSAAISLAFHLARHGLDLRAPVVIGALFHVSLISALYASGLSLAFAFAALPLTVAVGFLVSLRGDMIRAPATGRLAVTEASRRWRYSLGSFLVVATSVLVMGYVFDADDVTRDPGATLLALSVLWVWPVLRGGLQACAGPMEAKPTEMAWDVSGRRWIWLCVPVLWVLLSCTYNWAEWRLALDFLCVPVAIWLGARHGRTGFWVCAVGFIPLLAELLVGYVSSSGWIGGYFASLLACRYAGSSEFRRACFSARRLSRQQITLLAIGFCFLVSISSNMGATGFGIDNYLGFYVLAIVFLIGTSRIDLAEFIGPVAAVWLLLFATMLFRSEEFQFADLGPLSFVPAFPGVGYMVSVLGFFALGRLFRRWIASPREGVALVAPLAVVCFVVMILYHFGVAGRQEVGPDVSFVFRIDPIGYSLAWALIFALGVIGGGRGVLAAIGVLAAVKVGIPVAVNVLPLSGVLPVAANGWTVPVLDLHGAVTPYWRNFWGTGGLRYEFELGWRIGVGDFLLALAGWRVHKAIMEARRAGRWKREIEAATRRIQLFGATEPPLLTPNSYFDIAVPVAKVGLVVAAVMLLYNWVGISNWS